jgi:hypothetical protein
VARVVNAPASGGRIAHYSPNSLVEDWDLRRVTEEIKSAEDIPKLLTSAREMARPQTVESGGDGFVSLFGTERSRWPFPFWERSPYFGANRAFLPQIVVYRRWHGIFGVPAAKKAVHT